MGKGGQTAAIRNAVSERPPKSRPPSVRSIRVRDAVVTGIATELGDVDVSFVEVSHPARSMTWWLAADDHGIKRIGAASFLEPGQYPTLRSLPVDRIKDALAERLAACDDRGIYEEHAFVCQFLFQGGEMPLLNRILQWACGKASLSQSHRSRLNVLLLGTFDHTLDRIGHDRLWLGTRCPPRYEAPSLFRLHPEGASALHDCLSEVPWLWQIALYDAETVSSTDPCAALESLMDRTGIVPAKRRRLGPRSGGIDRRAARFLRIIPVDWVPGREDTMGWAALRGVIDAMGRVQVGDEVLASLLGHSKGRWEEFLGRIARVAGTEPGPVLKSWTKNIKAEPDFARLPTNPASKRMREAFGEAMDMRRSLVTTFETAVPGISRREVEDLATSMLMGGRGAISLLETSILWHREAARATGRERRLIEWPSLLPSWRDPSNGLAVIPLPNSHALADEGMRGLDPDGVPGLDHCVGAESYSIRCAQARIRILSIRDDRTRLSTAEIEVDPGRHGRPTLAVVQHRGNRNAEPEDRATATLEAYLRLPEATGLDARTVAAARLTAIARPFAEDFEPWRPFLVGKWRTVSAHDVLERLESLPRSGLDPQEAVEDMLAALNIFMD